MTESETGLKGWGQPAVTRASAVLIAGLVPGTREIGIGLCGLCRNCDTLSMIPAFS